MQDLPYFGNFRLKLLYKYKCLKFSEELLLTTED